MVVLFVSIMAALVRTTTLRVVAGVADEVEDAAAVASVIVVGVAAAGEGEVLETGEEEVPVEVLRIGEDLETSRARR